MNTLTNRKDAIHRFQIENNTEVADLLEKNADFLNSQAHAHGVDPALVQATILHDTRGNSDAFRSERQSSLSGESSETPPGNENSSLKASIQKNAVWLGVAKSKLLRSGISEPSSAQIATVYNSGRVGKVDQYGERVQWTYDKLKGGSVMNSSESQNTNPEEDGFQSVGGRQGKDFVDIASGRASVLRPGGIDKSSRYIPTTPQQRTELAQQIVNLEARRDAAGNVRIYKLPKSDGGGNYEVAGVNDKYDPVEFPKLRDLVLSGKQKEAEEEAAKYIASNTDIAHHWTDQPAIESYLRDSVFNRGAGGAAKILQIALGVKVDGHVGPDTLKALRVAEGDQKQLLNDLRAARERYELRYVGKREDLWDGLVNRWDNSLQIALQYLDD